MAKFTVFFKNKAIQSFIFDSGVIHIGRDETNDIVIDNLAIAPVHAVVIIKGDSCIIKQLNDDFSLSVNRDQIKEALLKNDDRIILGKHTIVFSDTESVVPVLNNNVVNKDVQFLNGQIQSKLKLPDANLQVLDGKYIGRIVPLKKSMTRFGHSGSGVVVIAKRKDGYFLSALEGDRGIMINQEPLADRTVCLNNNDIIVIDNISMQFFLEG